MQNCENAFSVYIYIYITMWFMYHVWLIKPFFGLMLKWILNPHSAAMMKLRQLIGNLCASSLRNHFEKPEKKHPKKIFWENSEEISEFKNGWKNWNFNHFNSIFQCIFWLFMYPIYLFTLLRKRKLPQKDGKVPQKKMSSSHRDNGNKKEVWLM